MLNVEINGSKDVLVVYPLLDSILVMGNSYYLSAYLTMCYSLHVASVIASALWLYLGMFLAVAVT